MVTLSEKVKPKKGNSLLLKLLVVFTILSVIIVSVWYASNLKLTNSSAPGSPVISPTTNPQQSPSPPNTPSAPPQAASNPPQTVTPTINPTSQPATTPTPTSAPTAPPAPSPTPPPTPFPPTTATFDFDTGSPIVQTGTGTPLSQTKNGITAQIRSPSDPAAFSIQNYDKTFYKLSQLTGNYLYDNRPSRDILEIKFDQQLTSITFTFATFEFHGGPGDPPSNMTITAYLDSTANLVGTTSGHGVWPSGDSYPQGTLTYNSGGQPFNLVRIEMSPFQGPTAAVDYLIDNITVMTP